MTDAELRCTREGLGMPIRELASVTGMSESQITDAEHGTTPVPTELESKIQNILKITEDYIDRLMHESKERGYILTYRFNGEMSGQLPEYGYFGSMWHRQCAFIVQGESGLQIKYLPRKARISV